MCCFYSQKCNRNINTGDQEHEQSFINEQILGGRVRLCGLGRRCFLDLDIGIGAGRQCSSRRQQYVRQFWRASRLS
jgi:hypothetical protein